ncbi:hypothetical protein RYH73_09055 [Olivibacter sp. CPCC 100613]|uniref:hypothetical protein n=1 Tax=Olivibacter sp. CPCC 100613 TaxID=3079931 RepID=UPI002FFB57FB
MKQEISFYLLQADKFNPHINRKEHLLRIYPKMSWEAILSVRREAYRQDPIITYLKENIVKLSSLGFKEIAEEHLTSYERETYPELFFNETSIFP